MAARKSLFDSKFGAEFIKGVPLCPGVYEMLDATGTTIYVGKAKILRRRLQQYRNARRCKKHHKMRRILGEAHSLRFQACASDLEALLLENELIQKLRPRFNIAGAFSFLYPMIGLKREGLYLYLCYSTSPHEFPMFDFHGAYRSRHITHEAFEALLEVLSFIGHPEPSKDLGQFPRVRFSRVAGFRQVQDQWVPWLEEFFRGETTAFLENAVLALVEKPFARRHAAETQELFDSLERFYKFEARPLARALKTLGGAAKSISQEERDRLFLNAKHLPAPKRRPSAQGAAGSS